MMTIICSKIRILLTNALVSINEFDSIIEILKSKKEFHALNEEAKKELMGKIRSLNELADFINKKYIIKGNEKPTLYTEYVIGDLRISKKDLLPKNITHVSGNIVLRNRENVSLSNLSFVGGKLDIRDAKVVELPRVKTVVGFIKASSAIVFNAPELETVGGSFIVNSVSTINISNLKSIAGAIHINSHINDETTEIIESAKQHTPVTYVD